MVSYGVLVKVTTQVRKSSKMGPHLGRILLKRAHFSLGKAVDLHVRKALFRLWKHCLFLNTMMLICGTFLKMRKLYNSRINYSGVKYIVSSVFQLKFCFAPSFYQTHVYLGSDLWIRVSLTH